MLSKAGKWFDWLNRVLAVIGCTLFVLITLAIGTEIVTLAIGTEIVTRAAFDISNDWLVELSEISLLYITFLGAAWVLGNDKHVSIDLLLNMMGERTIRVLHIALSLVAAATCFVITWFGVFTVIDQYVSDIREPTIMAPLTFWITAIVPFGFALLGIQFLRRGLRAAAGLPLAVGQD